MTRLRMTISTSAAAAIVAIMLAGPQVAHALTNLPLAKLSSI